MKTNLHYWHRQKQGSQAEVDYVIQVHDQIISIEVKASAQGQKNSLYLFLDEKNSKLGIRTSMENGSSYDRFNIWPLYAIGNVVRQKIKSEI